MLRSKFECNNQGIYPTATCKHQNMQQCNNQSNIRACKRRNNKTSTVFSSEYRNPTVSKFIAVCELIQTMHIHGGKLYIPY